MEALSDPTRPVAVRLEVQELVLLDKLWAATDRYRSTELIDGTIYHTPSRHRPRAWAATELSMRLHNAIEVLPNAPNVLTRASIELSPYDLPMPDIVLTDEPRGEGFVSGDSVRLVIEVAQTAAEFFLGPKLRAYARHGVPEYWVIDLAERKVHRFSSLRAQGYREEQEVPFGERCTAATVEGLAVEAAGLE